MIRIAHFADVHLGRRQFYRFNQHGINIREADTARAFRHAVKGIEAAQPDLIVCSGDLFHSILPTNVARLEAARAFKRLAAIAPTFLASGNHSTPRTIETGSPVSLLAESVPDLTVAVHDPVTWVRPDGQASVCLLPHAAVLHGEQPKCPGTPCDILVIHGATPGLHSPDDSQETISHPWNPETAGGWRYVALGDYHVVHQVAANAWYAGSLEYVSSDPWSELKAEAGRGKGWILVTLEPGQAPLVEFQPVPTRVHRDFPVIDGQGRSSAEVAAMLPPFEEGAVVRQLVTGLARKDRRELQGCEQFKAASLRALNFRLDCRTEKRIPLPINLAMDADDPCLAAEREPWEIEQDRASHYWEPSEYDDAEPLPTTAQFNAIADPYHIDERKEVAV